MNKLCILFTGIFVLTFLLISAVHAATVGNPADLDLPPRSAMLRQQAVDQSLDEYEETVKVKAAMDIELLFDKDLNTTSEVSSAEMKGEYYMLKLATTLFNRVEPYIKVGSSNLEVTWRQGPQDLLVETDPGLAWGGGVKAVLWEFEDLGLRLTGDAQYRYTEPDVNHCSIDGVGRNTQGSTFEIEEWQASLLVSKKLEIPLRWGNSVYLAPYTGVTFSDSNVDVKIIDQTNPAADYTLFKANNDSVFGFVGGLDILPSLKSSYVYNIEVRLGNETALSLGGAMKF